MGHQSALGIELSGIVGRRGRIELSRIGGSRVAEACPHEAATPGGGRATIFERCLSVSSRCLIKRLGQSTSGVGQIGMPPTTAL